MSYSDRQRPSYGISSPHAPWRRAARPLALLFSLQLSGIGCAARAPELPEPTRPDELSPYLEVYEAQLESAGMSLEGAQDYITGRTDSPFPQDDDVAAPASDSIPNAVGSQVGEETYKVIDGVAEYRIGPGDLLLVTTYLGPEPPTGNVYRIQADGTLVVSRFNIGSVQAAGLTPSELTRALTDEYRQYVPNGYVEARVQEHTAWRATLTGEIRNVAGGGPGSYVLDGRTTVSDFIYRYGGPNATADLADVRVLRGSSQRQINITAVLAGTAEDFALRSGDVVRVPSIEQGSSRMFILGEVQSPGVYTYSEGSSVLDAIAQAGGYTQNAHRSAVFISRPGTGEVIPVNLDVTLGSGQAAAAPELVAGDFVVIPYSPNRSELIRDWVGIFSLILSALTIIELVRRD